MNQNTFSKEVHLSTYSQDKGLRITEPQNSIGLDSWSYNQPEGSNRLSSHAFRNLLVPAVELRDDPQRRQAAIHDTELGVVSERHIAYFYSSSIGL